MASRFAAQLAVASSPIVGNAPEMLAVGAMRS